MPVTEALPLIPALPIIVAGVALLLLALVTWRDCRRAEQQRLADLAYLAALSAALRDQGRALRNRL